MTESIVIEKNNYEQNEVHVKNLASFILGRYNNVELSELFEIMDINDVKRIYDCISYHFKKHF